MIVTTCLMPLPRWHDELDVSLVAVCAAFAVCAVCALAAIVVPARPSVPSSAAEPAAAVTRSRASRRPARRCASRPLLISCFLSRVRRGAPQAGTARANDPTLSASSADTYRYLFVQIWGNNRVILV